MIIDKHIPEFTNEPSLNLPNLPTLKKVGDKNTPSITLPKLKKAGDKAPNVTLPKLKKGSDNVPSKTKQNPDRVGALLPKRDDKTSNIIELPKKSK